MHFAGQKVFVIVLEDSFGEKFENKREVFRMILIGECCEIGACRRETFRD